MRTYGDSTPPSIENRGILEAGEIVSDYRIKSIIAQGGFGAVYRAEHVGNGNVVALKVLHESRNNAENLERFRREVAALRDNLETRKLVERAKGALMEAGLSEAEAYLALQKRARDGRASMRQAAEAVLAESAHGGRA